MRGADTFSKTKHQTWAGMSMEKHRKTKTLQRAKNCKAMKSNFLFVLFPKSKDKDPHLHILTQQHGKRRKKLARGPEMF